MSDGNESTFCRYDYPVPEGGGSEEPTLKDLDAVFAAIHGALSTLRRDDLSRMTERICRAVEKICSTAGDEAPAAKRPRGGLAPWQIRKLRVFIESNLDRNLSVQALASLVGFSQCHLSRSFRKSFGTAPHAYIIRKRVSLAQSLMLSSRASLGQIAADCGLADQAHLTKLFSRLIGESPAAWRRARAHMASSAC